MERHHRRHCPRGELWHRFVMEAWMSALDVGILVQPVASDSQGLVRKSHANVTRHGAALETYGVFVILRFCDFAILRFYVFAILRFCDLTVLRFCDFVILRFYDFTSLRLAILNDIWRST